MNVYWLEQCAADVPLDDDWLNRHESERLNLLRIPKRRADWRLGRWTAKLAVAAFLKLGSDLQTLEQFEITSDITGAPLVFFQNMPVDLCISISHREARAVCALSPAGTRVGCDLEFIEEHGAAFVEDYFTIKEQAMVGDALPGDRTALVALLWSAKESTLKALQTGLRLDTRSVEVKFNRPVISNEARSCTRDLASRRNDLAAPCSSQAWSELSVACDNGQIFEGWWQQRGEFITTIVTTTAATTPVLLAASNRITCASSRAEPLFL